MNLRSLEKILASRTGYSASEIDQRMRPLRELGMVPHGPRGPAAPHIEHIHAAIALLSLAARRATDVGPVVAKAIKMKAVPRAGLLPFDQDEIALVTAIASTLAGATIVERVEILPDASLAWVTFGGDGLTQRVLFTADKKTSDWVEEFPDTYDAQGEAYCGHRLVLTRAFLEQLALELADDEKAAGWMPEREKAVAS